MRLALKTILFLVLPILFLGSIHWGTFSEYPQFVHAWANYDYLALAYGFIDNGFDFFHPQTYVLNHQFPSGYMVPSQHGTTPVDFPIHTYIVALFMKLFHTKSPMVFYVYQFAYAQVGVLFAGLLFHQISRKFSIAFLGVLLMLSSSVFVYYVHSFLPTICSLSNLFIGLYFLNAYLQNQEKSKKLYVGLFFLTLAALARTPFIIPVIAAFMAFVVHHYATKKESRFLWMPWVISFSLIGSYAIYNMHLREEFGSMFLGDLRPPENFMILLMVFVGSLRNWMLHYFQPVVWVVFIATAGYLALTVFKKSAGSYARKLPSIPVLFSGFYLLGVCAYSLLMCTQFVVHDYYFLDTFFVPFLLLFVAVCTYVQQHKSWANKAILFATILLMASSWIVPKQIAKRRTASKTDFRQRSTELLIQHQAWFKQLSLPKDATLLLLNPTIPNAAFCLFNTKGYVLMNSAPEAVKTALLWDYDYVLVMDGVDIPPYFPATEIEQQLSLVSKGNGVSLYEKKR
jgi:hypothetical protein